jgi:gamma-D-glutamyl-L-lysine dipeptidyl-peptidase
MFISLPIGIKVIHLQKRTFAMFGVIDQSLAALRKEPFERSEMVNQLLFGETFSIIEEHREWLRIAVNHDGYEGWIDTKMCQMIDDEQMSLLTINGIASVATRLFSAQHSNSEYPIRLCPGSTLYNFDSNNGTFTLLGESYKTFNIPIECIDQQAVDNLIQFAKSYVNAPYLWGGRSPMGIDCSGLVQVIFKMLGISIPRDASQQVELGSSVDFINLVKPGDLAFFDDNEGNIIHVGIVLPENRIIHSSGYVKIDKLDQHGIYSIRKQNYTHKLRVVKRIMED